MVLERTTDNIKGEVHLPLKQPSLTSRTSTKVAGCCPHLLDMSGLVSDRVLRYNQKPNIHSSTQPNVYCKHNQVFT